jgi:hypothetical protein
MHEEWLAWWELEVGLSVLLHEGYITLLLRFQGNKLTVSWFLPTKKYQRYVINANVLASRRSES